MLNQLGNNVHTCIARFKVIPAYNLDKHQVYQPLKPSRDRCKYSSIFIHLEQVLNNEGLKTGIKIKTILITTLVVFSLSKLRKIAPPPDCDLGHSTPTG